ncbi:hypothetical protein GV828_08640 [Flavobacterium sp. NST-5]|uniref:DUF6265 domain-containing protein n=1 Tax=Flavobacterium ichthyis TaxID=2698827 RepID=A0ABW9Z8Q4_9FLAO|nr:DUF6265 family protein [Flavobacterium ichthyis]NBL65260.1 hypothetical protein [Flavobacterium ichthyis]
MKTEIKFFACCLLLGLFSCKEAHDAQRDKPEMSDGKYFALTNVEWLLGRWENNSPEGNLSEIWKKENDSTLLGESYFVIKNDTVFGEKVKLFQSGTQLVYEVNVANQNDGKAVAFESTFFNNKTAIFENKNHDYPNKIIYNKVSDDSLVVTISGLKKGIPADETFKMKKIN